MTEIRASALLGAMVAIARDKDRLIVSQGPSAGHKFLTCVAAIIVLVGVVFFIDRVGSGTWMTPGSLATLAGPLLLMVGLVSSWRSTEYHFDRSAAMLVVGHCRPARPPRTREVPFAAVSAVVDRQLAEETLKKALGRIEARTAKITNVSLKDSYLKRRRENRRAFELAERWFGRASG